MAPAAAVWLYPIALHAVANEVGALYIRFAMVSALGDGNDVVNRRGEVSGHNSTTSYRPATELAHPAITLEYPEWIYFSFADK